MKASIDTVPTDLGLGQAPNAEDSADVLFMQDYIDQAPVGNDADARLEADVAEFIVDVNSREERLRILDILTGRVAELKSPALQLLVEEQQDARYGDTVIEATLEDLQLGIERSLQGKNPMVVIRSGDYEDYAQIEEAITKASGGMQRVSEMTFPRSGMRATNSSVVHLDNFVGNDDQGFKYGLSTSTLEEGQAVFVGGFASKSAQMLSVGGYQEREGAINNHPAVRALFSEAARSDRVSSKPINVRELRTILELIKVNPGDVIIWPQGGEGSEAPIWHAIRQVGDASTYDFVPRRSTSRHYALPEKAQ